VFIVNIMLDVLMFECIMCCTLVDRVILVCSKLWCIW